MKMSEAKQTEVYTSIHEPIMKTRIGLKQQGLLSDEVDSALYSLTDKIWREIKHVLKVEK